MAHAFVVTLTGLLDRVRSVGWAALDAARVLSCGPELNERSTDACLTGRALWSGEVVFGGGIQEKGRREKGRGETHTDAGRTNGDSFAVCARWSPMLSSSGRGDFFSTSFSFFTYATHAGCVVTLPICRNCCIMWVGVYVCVCINATTTKLKTKNKKMNPLPLLTIYHRYL